MAAVDPRQERSVAVPLTTTSHPDSHLDSNAASISSKATDPTAATVNDRLLNAANQLTTLRLLLSFVLFGAISCQWWWSSLLLFWLAMSTDWLDGLLARRLGLSGVLGRIYDPVVDKVLLSGVLICLLQLPTPAIATSAAPTSGVLAGWMVAVVVAREYLVTALRGLMEQRGIQFGADWFGKLKTILQTFAISIILLNLGLDRSTTWTTQLHGLEWGLVWAMLGATLCSGIHYLYHAWPALNPPTNR